VSTLIRLEAAGWGEIPGSMKSVNPVLEVLEKRGVIFSELGVQLAKKPRR
jgi:DNA-binding PadR family transcriptional regulator